MSLIRYFGRCVLTLAVLTIMVSAAYAGPTIVYVEAKGEQPELEEYREVKYIGGKSTRHFTLAWQFDFNEINYKEQCTQALSRQASNFGANGILNMTWELETSPYPPYSWYTIVCQGLAVRVPS